MSFEVVSSLQKFVEIYYEISVKFPTEISSNFWTHNPSFGSDIRRPHFSHLGLSLLDIWCIQYVFSLAYRCFLVRYEQQLGGSSPGKHSPGCIEFGKFEINSWYSSPFPRDLAKYVCMCLCSCHRSFSKCNVVRKFIECIKSNSPPPSVLNVLVLQEQARVQWSP